METAPGSGSGRRTDERADDGDDVRTPGLPADLRPVEGGWDALQVPRGWRPIAAIARTVSAELDPLVDRVTDCIGVEIPAYRQGVVPRDDLRASVLRNIEAILLGLAEHRGPSAEEVAVRRELGSRRALQGLPVDALIQAYHVGYRELWLSLVRALPPGDQRTATKLLTAATTVWQWVHELTDAIAASHAATVRSLEARAVGARQRFVELLVAGDLDGEEATRLCASLGFDPAGSFVATVVQTAPDGLDAPGLQRAVERRPGRHAVAARGTRLVVVSQDTGGDEVVAVCRTELSRPTVGVGAARAGLRGARSSLEDAERTLAVTPAGATGVFEEAWLWAELAKAGERLRPLLEPGVAVAARHPHLAAAVLAFAEGGFSVSGASRRLGLHANTVGYRLDRWHELTGWDPRGFEGLVRSVAAVRAGGDAGA